MSYSRWSNSCWYSFYNSGGYLSLWYSLDKMIDISFEQCSEITPQKLKEMYDCTDEEAKEAMEYIGYFIEEYDTDEI